MVLSKRTLDDDGSSLFKILVLHDIIIVDHASTNLFGERVLQVDDSPLGDQPRWDASLSLLGIFAANSGSSATAA